MHGQEKKMDEKINLRATMIVLSIVILALIAKLVLAAIYSADPTTNSGGTLTTNVYANGGGADGPTGSGSWADGFVGDFNIAGQSGTITTVEVCFDLSTTFTSCAGQCDDFYLEYSYDGSEGSPTTLETITSASVDYTDGTGHKCYDITSDNNPWSWADISTINMHVDANKIQGPDTFTMTIDYLYVKVTYDEPDTSPPIITLLDPENNGYATSSTVEFNFSATDATAINNCTLWGNFSGSWTQNESTTLITDNTETNITINLADGVYLWNIECYDNDNNGNFSAINYTARVDTTVPTIYLENPEDNNLSSTSSNTFFFNVTDIMANVSSCELIVDGTIKDTTSVSPVPEQTTQNLTATLTNGDHDWWINCTDAAGWENTSEIRNISVNVLTETIQTEFSSYEQGETATISGENWAASETISINITLTNSSFYIFNTTSDGSGAVSTTYNISYDHPLGQQNITAFQYTNISINATNFFTVTARVATITIDKTSYFEGESVYINGSGFSTNTMIELNFTNLATSWINTTLANTLGEFNFTYNLSYSETLGLWNLTVLDQLYSNLNDSGNFTVNDRVANIWTDKFLYNPDETVYLFGSWFSVNGSVRITLKNEDTGTISPDYPQTILANNTGNMSNSWFINNTCGGNYSFNAYDLAYNELNDTTDFNISQSSANQDTTPESAYRNNVAGIIDVGFINESDDNYTDITISSSNTDYYLEMNWSNAFTSGTTIDSITFWAEHYEGTNKPSVTLRWLNGSTYQDVSCPGISNTLTDANQSCDLSSVITNYSQANNISLRLIFRKSSGGATTAYIDYAHINISYSGDAACTAWGNTAPTIDSFTMTSPINLLAGQTTSVYCNASVTDTQDDLVSANATFYYYLNASSDPDNNNVHYTNSSCSFTGTISKEVTCTFDTWYYANNGTWYCNMTIADSEFVSNDYNSTTINPLYALNISTTLIDYGDVPLASISSNYTANISNLGNMPINISVYGYGGDSFATGENLSFICDQTGNISIGYEKYSVSPLVYSSKTNLTSVATTIPLTIPKQTAASSSQNSTYWQIQVAPDNNPDGKCNGSIVFTAEVS